MNTLVAALALVLVPVFLAVALLSAGPATGKERVVQVDAYGMVAFADLDSDRNGFVSRVEARSVSGVEQIFDTADINRDGLLDRHEYTRAQRFREAR
ncbi:MAG TPA: hypothetical protein ENJ79_02430 [Gammaproteobacteria bacterium]|nr:hypothetical protein [Gammaproteobacteria bacterium]